MRSGARCAVEVIEAANQVGNPVATAVEIINSAQGVSDIGGETPVIACERCGAQLRISTELGEDKAQLMLQASPNSVEGCRVVRGKQDGDWVTNLSARWFELDLLTASDEEGGRDTSDAAYVVSPTGLNAVVNDIIRDTVQAREARNGNDFVRAVSPTELEAAVDIKTGLLDTLLPREEGSTWQAEIDVLTEELPRERAD